ncbi:hypothetical protein M011DRAFT_466027, partial [Sporormia fimetaria CBS 119925]
LLFFSLWCLVHSCLAPPLFLPASVLDLHMATSGSHPFLRTSNASQLRGTQARTRSTCAEDSVMTIAGSSIPRSPQSQSSATTQLRYGASVERQGSLW